MMADHFYFKYRSAYWERGEIDRGPKGMLMRKDYTREKEKPKRIKNASQPFCRSVLDKLSKFVRD